MVRAILVVIALAGLPAAAEAPLRTIQVRVGGHALRVEVARTDPQRQKGLMFREKLGRDDGMLFVFDEPAYQSMWMKNTLIPLSVAFLDGQGIILNIADMEPGSLDSHMSAGPSLYAVETNKGWFAERRIRAGERFTGLPPAPRP